MSGKTGVKSDGVTDKSDDATGLTADDVALQLKKKARRRLVGAIALALFAVITLPMVMDHQPRPSAPEIQVRIPSQDGPGFSGRIAPGTNVKPTPLPPAATSVVAKAEAPAPVAESAAKPMAPPAADVPHKTAEATPPQPMQKSPAVESHKPAAESAPVVAKALVEPTKAAPTPAKAADEPRALAVLNGTDSPSSASNAPWVVQLGAYKEAGNVKLLQFKIKEMNIPVFTEKFESPEGPRTRVRAGPFPTRTAAEKAQTRIRIIGVNGVVAQQ